MIVADTLRRLESVRGLDPGRDTPTLQNFIGSSVCFENAVASSPWSMPSHWSLMNGLDPWNIAPRASDASRLPTSGSMAHYWTERGGTALSLSQNDLVSRDESLLAGYTSVVPPSNVRIQRALAVGGSFIDMGVGVTGRAIRKRTDPLGGPVRGPVRRPVDWCYAALLRAAGATGRVLTRRRERDSFLRGLAAQIDETRPSEPIHAFLNLMYVHEPYVHAPTSVEGALSTGLIPTNNLALHGKNLRTTCTQLDPLHAAYREALRDLDRGLAQVLGVLRRTGVLDDALVVLVSDHGQALGEGGRFGHGWTMQDEVVRIPAYVWDTRHLRAPSSSTVIREWIDHRHLHDVLLDQLESPGKPLETSVADALVRRGPAVSHFRGRPASGFNLAKRLAVRERVRVWQDGSEVEMYRPSPDLSPEVLRATGSDSDLLQELAFRTLSIPRGPADSDSDASGVYSRLESWGYN